MSKRNYTNYASKGEPVDVETPVETVDEVEMEPVYGVVSYCVKLNIREAPTRDSAVICSVDSDTKLLIDPAKSTDEWLNVYLPEGIEGFCMKKFVIIT